MANTIEESRHISFKSLKFERETKMLKGIDSSITLVKGV